ncbi:aminopeptidase [Pseudobacteriovorax antillogorgiicola]|uniref:Predicted aminopeptidase n=1 Tax=Pseudobacteriovorax antillogorgiicola TaxID=1513793 RepID=A0A1Y6B8U1_9BACT|nr:aminopeptidase [Pseudobacteriovorax antillogorgiicola]TCS59210.1 putative aminopeptidase [Pseudobacteriovorax antillogorgiicola]SME90521.1 Predicted aminopeptidase [Pseudobacteriovorax antillogorgiicola]
MPPFLLLVILASANFSCYSLRQAYHFNNLFNSRQKVSAVLGDDNTRPKVKEKLSYVTEVIQFADSQGLNTEGAYEYYIHSKSGSVSYLVQAAEQDRLKFKKWWFPIVGSVPYLGFFDSVERDQEFQRLSASYDVAKGNVGAFSSLGWFEDPIYTSMIRRSDLDIAHLFFHELVHRTFWSAGSVRFNENLAEFGAEVLMVAYLETTGEATSSETYFARRRDKAKFKEWLGQLRQELEEMYQREGLSRQEKIDQKWVIIDRYRTRELPQFETNRYDYVRRKAWNNASILGASLYTPDTQRFYQSYDCVGRPSLGKFLSALKDAEGQFEDNFKALDSLCETTELRR